MQADFWYYSVKLCGEQKNNNNEKDNNPPILPPLRLHFVRARDAEPEGVPRNGIEIQ